MKRAEYNCFGSCNDDTDFAQPFQPFLFFMPPGGAKSPGTGGRSPVLLAAQLYFENQRISGGIAQLARAVALQAIGLGFKSPYLQLNYHIR